MKAKRLWWEDGGGDKNAMRLFITNSRRISINLNITRSLEAADSYLDESYLCRKKQVQQTPSHSGWLDVMKIA
jgi:hypothetical protein